MCTLDEDRIYISHAEAEITQSNCTIYKAQELYERNPDDDPSTSGKPMCNIIRRWPLQDLTSWAGCVVQIAAREGTANVRALYREFKRKGTIPFMTNI